MSTMSIYNELSGREATTGADNDRPSRRQRLATIKDHLRPIQSTTTYDNRRQVLVPSGF